MITNDFLEHASQCSSQYDETCRSLATELLAARKDITELKVQLLAAQLNLNDAQQWNVAYRERIELGQALVKNYMEQLASLGWKTITPDTKFEVGKRYLVYSNANAASSPFEDGTINIVRWAERGNWLIQGWTHYCSFNLPEVSE